MAARQTPHTGCSTLRVFAVAVSFFALGQILTDRERLLGRRLSEIVGDIIKDIRQDSTPTEQPVYEAPPLYKFQTTGAPPPPVVSDSMVTAGPLPWDKQRKLREKRRRAWEEAESQAWMPGERIGIFQRIKEWWALEKKPFIARTLLLCTVMSALRRSDWFVLKVWEPFSTQARQAWRWYLSIGDRINNVLEQWWHALTIQGNNGRRGRPHVHERWMRENERFYQRLLGKTVTLGGLEVPNRLLGAKAVVKDVLPFGRLLVRVKGIPFLGSGGEELELHPGQIRITRQVARDVGTFGWKRRWNSVLGMMQGPTKAETVAHVAFNLTNGYRRTKRLPPLQWNQGLAEIAQRHSRDMAEGAVRFGHDGFQQRAKMFPFLSTACAENVAMSENARDPADSAVGGWVKSDGHRANLESQNYNLCAIGAYRVPGTERWFLTQLFGCYPGLYRSSQGG